MALGIQVSLRGIDELIVGLHRAPEVLHGAMREAMQRSVLIVEAQAKRRVPRRTGRLFSSIGGRVIQAGPALEGRVGTPVSYASVVEFGSRPHIIQPKNAQALRIPLASGGGFGGARLDGGPRRGQGVAFFRRVRHPGTHGRHYMTGGVRASVGQIQQAFIDAAKRALAAVASK